MMHVQMVNQLTGITATITRVAPFPSERMSTNVLPAGMMRFHPGMMSASANSVIHALSVYFHCNRCGFSE